MRIISTNKEGTNLPVMIFRNVFDSGISYSTTVSHKNINGEYENAFINVRFKKNVDVENKQQILIKDAWLDFYQSKDDKNVFYIFVNDFDKVK